jgi:glycosyltransferase involved in cell wall biosynthesis
VRNVFLKGIYHWMWGGELFSGAGAVIATAQQEQAELMTGGIPTGKIVLRRNGVEAPPEGLPQRGTFRASLGIPPQAKLLLFLGRLSNKKSPDLLLEAFASPEIVNATGERQVHLAFVGPDEGNMLSKLQSMAKELNVSGNVHFSKALEGDKKWAAYRDADIFVLPSQNENFGNTAAEAVAAGTPVIVTDQCGIAPLLKDMSGVVVKHDRADLIRGLKELLQDEALYGKLHGGCSSAFRNLGWTQPLLEMEALYGRLLGPSDRKQI